MGNMKVKVKVDIYSYEHKVDLATRFIIEMVMVL